MNKFQDVTQTPIQQPKPFDNKQFLHTTIAGAFLPLLQSLITSLIVALVITWIAYQNNVVDFWNWGITSFLITLFIIWLIHQRRWFDLTKIEREIHLGISGEPEAPKHEPRVIRIKIDETKSNGHYQQDIIEFPIDDDQLATLAEGLINGIPFAERRWAGDGKPFSIDEFRAIRSIFIARGLLALASNKDRRQGYILTEKGRATMEQIAAPSPSLLKEQE